MRILYIINSMKMGGAEKLLVDLLPSMAEKGIHCELLVLNGSDTPLLQQLKASGITMTSLDSGSVYNPAHIFRILPHLSRFDLIHTHLFPTLYWVAMARILSRAKAKFVYTEHSVSNRRRDKWLFTLCDKILYKRYDRIVSIAHEADRKLKAHLKFDARRFSVVPNGIPVKAFSDALPYPKQDFFSQGDYLIIQVSSFRYPKDQQTLIKALSRLPGHFKLLLVGEGGLRGECERLVSTLGITDSVQFLGNRSDVPRLLKTCDAVVLSSHYEGLSLSSIEGMSSGKPFLASDVPGLSEVVKGAGLLFEDGNDVQLADQLLKLEQDPLLTAKVVSNCQERASEFDISNTVDGYFHIYRNLLNRTV